MVLIGRDNLSSSVEKLGTSNDIGRVLRRCIADRIGSTLSRPIEVRNQGQRSRVPNLDQAIRAGCEKPVAVAAECDVPDRRSMRTKRTDRISVRLIP